MTGGLGAGVPGRSRGTQTRSALGQTAQVTGVDGASVEPGHSAVGIMAVKVAEDKFASALQPFGGTILKTSLSESDEKELAEQLT